MSEVAKINKEGESQYDPYYMYGNTEEGGKAIKRWSEGYDNDFAARMDWSITNNYNKANHHPVAVLNGDRSRNVVEVKAYSGATIELSAAGSIDPDGNALSYKWFLYKEPSTYKEEIHISKNTAESAYLKIPEKSTGKTIHIILEIRDNGSPNLIAYRRVIINVN